MRFILDTNVISEFMRSSPDATVAAWFAKNNGYEFATTTINQAEVFAGLALLPLGKKKKALESAAHDFFNADIANRIFYFDSAAALESASIRAARAGLGHPISFPDACIAAIAKVQNATIVTRDTGGFAQTGIQVVNPWFDI